ncbi:ISAs1 family transposase [Candidatus Chlorohelix sp.]|uniref:ISAs1 family transposase n=1 Tax=Candidatus Chlorohelix sp. TaxID=3139201 RepID=UPI0030211DA3
MQSTFQRLFAELDPVQLEEALTSIFDAKVVGSIRQIGSEGIAIDGKCQRGRLKFEETKGTPCHLLSAFCQQSGIVLGQIAIENKEAELTIAPALIDQIDWEGRVLTGDAIFCQRNLCQQVVKAGGDYLFIVKGNQAKLQTDLEMVFEPDTKTSRWWRTGAELLEMREAKTVDKGHGRIEIREIRASTELAEYSDWPYLAQVFEIRRSWVEKGQLKTELQLGITRLPKEIADVKALLEFKRGHWGIENKLHWVKDVGFGEDASLIHKVSGPHVMAALRNTALNLLRKAGYNKISSRLRFISGHPEHTLALLGLNA